MDTEIKRRYPRLRKYAIPSLILIALAVAIIWAVAASKTTSYKTDKENLMVRVVTEGEFNDYIHLAGKVETGLIVQVSALETGIVDQKLVEEGAMVSEGDIILTS